MANTTTARTAQKQLDRLRATWSTTGSILSGKTAGETFAGEDSYEWLPGERFLLHRWDIEMPDGRKRGIEVIGFDKGTRTIAAHQFDSDGNISEMRVEFARSMYRIVGEAMRFTGELDPDGKRLVGIWERKAKKGWDEWMEITLSRDAGRTR